LIYDKSDTRVFGNLNIQKAVECANFDLVSQFEKTTLETEFNRIYEFIRKKAG